MKVQYKEYKFLLTSILVLLGFNALAQDDSLPPFRNLSVSESDIRVMYCHKNIAYDTQASVNVVSSLENVKGDVLEKNFTTNFGNKLFGRLAGLHAVQDGSEPGIGWPPSFRMRGITSFSSAAQNPLVIIDGFITNPTDLSNALQQLTAEEVEDVTVLKDAAATAIYGQRSANGVILITTKKGINDGLEVNFGTSQGFNQAQYLPKFLGAYDYTRLFAEAQKNDGVSVPKYSYDDIEKYRLGTDPIYHPDINWYDQVLRKKSYVSNYNLNLRGGGGFAKYFALLNVINSQGLFKKFGDLNTESSNTDYKRYNFRANVDMAISKRFSAQVKLGGSFDESISPYGISTNGIFGLLAQIPPNAFPVYNPDSSFGGNNLYANPYAELLAKGFYKTNSRTILSSLKLTENLDFLLDGLSVSAAVSLNNYYRSATVRSKTYARYAITPGTNGEPVYSSPFGTTTSIAAQDYTLDQYRNYVVQGFLNYKKQFGKSDIDAMLVMSTDNVTLYQTSDGAVSAYSTNPYKHNNTGGRVNYTYDNRYLLEAVAGYSGSDVFATGKRYGFFPAGAMGWIISNERFLKNSDKINFLKLRASFGLTGNDVIMQLGNTTRYMYMPTYGGAGYVFGTSGTVSSGQYEVQLGNQNYTWEKEAYLNIGLDATILKNLDFSINYFNRKRENILILDRATIPSYLGINTPQINSGKSSNKGFDASIKYTSNQSKDFQFFIEPNITWYKTKVLFNAEAIQINPLLYNTGLPIGQPIGFHAIGFYTIEDIIKRQADPKSVPGVINETIKAGDIKYADISGPAGVPDGIIDDFDQKPIGNPGLPNIFGGLHTGIKYKGFDLDIMLQGATGNTVYLSGSNFWAFQGNGQISPIALGRWTPETAATATYPRLSSKDNLNNYKYSDFWMRDGSFLKLRSAELGYTLPARIFDKWQISAFRIFLNGTNLWSWDKIEYGDPESLNGYPVLRTITMGLKIKF